MEESQIKQIIEQQPLHGSALLDPRCKILLLVCIGFVSYSLAGEVVSLALSLVFMARINRTVIVPLSEKQDAAV